MKENKYDNLVVALKKAYEDAQKAICEDGGTCNLDMPILDYRDMKMQKGKAIAAIERAGFSAAEYGGYLHIYGVVHGQGYCRTAMAEAFRDSLKNSGFSCRVYYQID